MIRKWKLLTNARREGVGACARFLRPRNELPADARAAAGLGCAQRRGPSARGQQAEPRAGRTHS